MPDPRHDIAKATGRLWPIQRHHALLAIEAFVLPVIAALPSTAFVNQERAGSFRARVELRLRGGRRTVMVLDRGSLTLEMGRARGGDAHISADSSAFMLVFIGLSLMNEWPQTEIARVRRSTERAMSRRRWRGGECCSCRGVAQQAARGHIGVEMAQASAIRSSW